MNDVQNIPISKIDISEWNVRTSDRSKGVEELAESILKHGLLQPIVVFQDGEKFKVIVGQRRLRAFKELKRKGHSEYKNIPAVILPTKPDEEHSRILSLSENIHRVELNRADVVEAIGYLYEKYKSAKKIARILGKSIPYVYDYLKIQYAPKEIKEMYTSHEISKEDVKRVIELAADDKDRMIELAKEMKELTPPEKARLVEVGRRKPRSKVKTLIEEAKKPGVEEKIIVPLTPVLVSALNGAAKQIGLSREEVAKKALQDWLTDKGYCPKGQ